MAGRRTKRGVVFLAIFGVTAGVAAEVARAQDKPTGPKETVTPAASTNSSAAAKAGEPAPQKTVEQRADGKVELLALDATVRGRRAKVEKKGENPHNIGFWTDVHDVAEWKLNVSKAGKYEVEVEYSLDRRSEGSEYAIEFGSAENRIEVQPKVTGTWLDFTKTKVGTVELKEGTITVTVRPTRKPGQAVLDLRGIRLTPVGK